MQFQQSQQLTQSKWLGEGEQEAVGAEEGGEGDPLRPKIIYMELMNICFRSGLVGTLHFISVSTCEQVAPTSNRGKNQKDVQDFVVEQQKYYNSKFCGFCICMKLGLAPPGGSR